MSLAGRGRGERSAYSLRKRRRRTVPDTGKDAGGKREAAASRLYPLEAGSVLPAPPPVNFPGKLLFLAPFAISARFYPGRISESSAKPSASALVLGNPV